MIKKYTLIILLISSFWGMTQNQPPKAVDPKISYLPYSQASLGQIQTDFLTKNFGMANVGIAHFNKYSPNLKNPALLTHNKFTILDVNTGINNVNTSLNNANRNDRIVSLNSLNIVFPFSFKWTSAFALNPYSSTSYGASTKIHIQGTLNDSIIQSDSAFGGIQQFSWSNGFNISKSLSLGTSINYLFGNITKESETRLLGLNSENVLSKQSSNYSGFMGTISAAFNKEITWAKRRDDYMSTTVPENNEFKDLFEQFDIKTDEKEKKKKNTERKMKIGLGVVMTSPLDSKRRTISTLKNNFNEIIDTTTHKVELPTHIGFGLSIGNVGRQNSWVISADYETTNQYTYNLGNTTRNIPNTNKLSFGFQITPEIESENFLKNTTYSFGAYTSKTPYLYNNEQLEEVGMHFGISFVDKAKRSNESFRWRNQSKTRLNYLSRYNLGIGFGVLGGNTPTSIQQTFIKLNLGISLNSEWFIRRKIN